jgi:hypothetical protein
MQEKNERVLADEPWPEKAISWPQSRHLEDYWRLLLAPWTFKSLSEEPKLPDIMALLSFAWLANQPIFINDTENYLQEINSENKPIVVDIGMGDAYALREMKEKEGFITVGLGMHEINPDNAKYIDLLAYSSVPNGRSARQVFNLLRGKVALVCESFGASTYADNPIEALIYEGLLLAPGGVAKLIVSSIPKESEEQSPLGFAAQRQRLVAFFKEHLGLELIISRTYIKSLVMKGSFCIDYHVEIRRAPNALVSDKSLEELFALAEKEMGHCTTVPKCTNVGEFAGGFGIRGRSYTRAGEAIQNQGMDYTQGILVKTFRLTGTENTAASISLRFVSNEFMNDFIIRFREYYLNNKEQPEWSIESDEQNKSTTFTYNGHHENGFAAMRQAREELSQIFPKLFTTSFVSSLYQKSVEHNKTTAYEASAFNP